MFCFGTNFDMHPTTHAKTPTILYQHFNDFNPSTARNLQVCFEKYAAFQTKQGSINSFDKFRNMFPLTLTEIKWNWFEPIMNNIQDMPTMKEKFKKRLILSTYEA